MLNTLKKFERGLIGLFGIAVAFLVLSIGLFFAVRSGTATYAINQLNMIILSIFVIVDGTLILACRHSEED